MTKTCGECKHLNRELAFCRACGAKWLNESDGANCQYFEQKMPPTNGDKIRQMSNEELAEFLTNPPCFVCSKGDAAGECTDTWRKKDCKSAILERLNAPAESEGEK